MTTVVERMARARDRLIADMPRQADSLSYIMENNPHLSESQRMSLAFAADMMRDAANALEQAPAGGVMLPRNIAETGIRQAIFNYMMGEEIAPGKGGWWGGTEEVEWVDGLYAAIIAAAEPYTSTPTLQDTGVTEEQVERALRAFCPGWPSHVPLSERDKNHMRRALEAAALTPRPQPDERDAVISAVKDLIDNAPIGDDEKPYVSDVMYTEFDRLVEAYGRLTHPSNTPKTDTGGK